MDPLYVIEIGYIVSIKLLLNIEWFWVSEQFSAVPWREQVTFLWGNGDDNDICFVLDKHARLGFYSVYFLKQQYAGRHVATLTHYGDSKPINLCSR